ncbi:anaphase-promoting complex subunit 2 [Strigomonas culicis]|uniref:Anaphase-promoting complex subunit 2 n=1 Tax=Strigomonas culicis TaxID=28005 RepID=S9TLB3_9TRYP|nr:anaphase-promoting complex subunit 2 [Strigomonas culicis]|eukprot:EPY19002.1 anaphase-promoting complex subunit 2 [Strigomonas culicis]
MIAASESRSSGGVADDEEDVSEEDALAIEIFGNAAQDRVLYRKDPVIHCLHGLNLSRAQEIKRLWLSVLEKSIQDKVNSLEEDYSEPCLKAFIEWEEEVVESFVHTVLREPLPRASGFFRTHRSDAQAESAVIRAEIDRWCTDLKKKLLISFARQRMSKFWDILVEYPDSRAALEDIQQCLQLCPDSGLKGELMDTVRCLLSSRLHKAGTGTEDILAMLIKTIHSLCVLLTKNEQNANIFAVISATLEHLRKRKDGVPAVVQVITQPNSDTTLYADLQATPQRNDPMDDDDFAPDEADTMRASARDRPDVLRVLLTAINAKLLVQEYQQTLAAHLLGKSVHDFDTTPEEEALERLKCVFGEDLLFNCVVMLRDIQMSRRITMQLRDLIKEKALRPPSPTTVGAGGPRAPVRGRETRAELAGRGSVRPAGPPQAPVRFLGGSGGAPSPTKAPEAPGREPGVQKSFFMDAPETSVDVLSMTAWPPKAAPRHLAGETVATPDTYKPHPSLVTYMNEVAEQYHVLKRNQKLSWILGQGRVVLELDQQDPGKQGALVKVEHTVSLFHASLILSIKEAEWACSERVPLRVIAEKLEVPEDMVLQHATRLCPAILDVGDGEVALQKRVASSTRYLFEEAAGEEEEEPPAGLTPEKIKVLTRMITALLKTQKVAKSVKDIHNSMKNVWPV